MNTQTFKSVFEARDQKYDLIEEWLSNTENVNPQSIWIYWGYCHHQWWEYYRYFHAADSKAL